MVTLYYFCLLHACPTLILFFTFYLLYFWLVPVVSHLSMTGAILLPPDRLFFCSLLTPSPWRSFFLHLICIFSLILWLHAGANILKADTVVTLSPTLLAISDHLSWMKIRHFSSLLSDCSFPIKAAFWGLCIDAPFPFAIPRALCFMHICTTLSSASWTCVRFKWHDLKCDLLVGPGSVRPKTTAINYSLTITELQRLLSGQ